MKADRSAEHAHHVRTRRRVSGASEGAERMGEGRREEMSEGAGQDFSANAAPHGSVPRTNSVRDTSSR